MTDWGGSFTLSAAASPRRLDKANFCLSSELTAAWLVASVVGACKNSKNPFSRNRVSLATGMDLISVGNESRIKSLVEI